MKNVLGIDLAGSEKRNTGICLMDKGLEVETLILNTNKQIIDFVKSQKPKIIGIDAPLCLPKGRHCLREHCKGKNHFRECDLRLRKLGIKFFPITLGPMRMLTERGIYLKNVFESLGFEVIESYPGAVQDILGLPRKSKGVDFLRKELQKYGIKNLKKETTHDELDAICSALMGKFYLENQYTVIGNPKEGLMILPRIKI